MITILTWLWREKGYPHKFDAQHVNNLMRSVRNNLSVPARFLCMTDTPEGIEDWIETKPLPDTFRGIKNTVWKTQNGFPTCYVRLDMYRPDAAETYGERILSIDLDCVILGSLDRIVSRTEDLVLCWTPSEKRPYNGSLQLLRAGTRPQVYETFTPELAQSASEKYLGSDQAWLAYCLGWTEARFTEQDGVCFYRSRLRNLRNPKPGTRILFFPGKMKPWDEKIRNEPTIRDYYGK